jgi:hypothetical protein
MLFQARGSDSTRLKGLLLLKRTARINREQVGTYCMRVRLAYSRYEGTETNREANEILIF